MAALGICACVCVCDDVTNDDLTRCVRFASIGDFPTHYYPLCKGRLARECHGLIKMLASPTMLGILQLTFVRILTGRKRGSENSTTLERKVYRAASDRLGSSQDAPISIKNVAKKMLPEEALGRLVFVFTGVLFSKFSPCPRSVPTPENDVIP